MRGLKILKKKKIYRVKKKVWKLTYWEAVWTTRFWYLTINILTIVSQML